MRKIGVSVIAICVLLAITVTPIFAEYLPEGGKLWGYWDGKLTTGSGNTCRIQYNVSYGDPYVIDYDTDFVVTPSDDRFVVGDAVYCQDYYVEIIFSSYTSNVLVLDANYLSFQFNLANYSDTSVFSGGYDGFQVHDVKNDQYFPSINNAGNGIYRVNIDVSNDYKGAGTTNIVLYPYCNLIMSFSYTRYYAKRLPSTSVDDVNFYTNRFSRPVTSVQLIVPTVTNNKVPCYYDNTVKPYNTQYNTVMINNNVQTIADAYTNNAQNITDTNSQINSTQSTVDSVHDQEMQWYTQNQQAIEAAGLSNEKLTDSKYQGVYPVANDFGQLWTSIGPTKYIYLFALMASLAAFMLRHKPFSHAGKEINYQTKTLK